MLEYRTDQGLVAPTVARHPQEIAPQPSPCAWSYAPAPDAIDRAVLDGTRRGELRRAAMLRLRLSRVVRGRAARRLDLAVVAGAR